MGGGSFKKLSRTKKEAALSKMRRKSPAKCADGDLNHLRHAPYSVFRCTAARLATIAIRRPETRCLPDGGNPDTSYISPRVDSDITEGS
ncbi:hypothetical protein PSAC2689_40551 [Paraburkholderia sacchari]